jgi:Tfp pilus assembly ATPase PilU
MNDGGLDGMQTFDRVLEKNLREGLITREVAMAYASNATNLALSISDLDEPRASKPVEQQVPETPSSPGDIQIDGFER